MTEKCYKFYGTKILNLTTQEIGLLICLWKNKFADGEVDYATCVDLESSSGFEKPSLRGVNQVSDVVNQKNSICKSAESFCFQTCLFKNYFAIARNEVFSVIQK